MIDKLTREKSNYIRDVAGFIFGKNALRGNILYFDDFRTSAYFVPVDGYSEVEIQIEKYVDNLGNQIMIGYNADYNIIAVSGILLSENCHW